MTSATIPETQKAKGDPHLAPGALWRKVETQPQKIVLEDVIGEGSYSTVHRGKFQERIVAVKIFRNTTKESAFKEIEILFSLRHPHVIGLYAWFRIKGELSIYQGKDVLDLQTDLLNVSQAL